jgi:hypothetical protein
VVQLSGKGPEILKKQNFQGPEILKKQNFQGPEIP